MGDEEKKVNPSYVEWLEQVIAEYQPDWICDDLVCEDGWCENHCRSNWNSECLKRYYSKHFDTPDCPVAIVFGCDECHREKCDFRAKMKGADDE